MIVATDLPLFPGILFHPKRPYSKPTKKDMTACVSRGVQSLYLGWESRTEAFRFHSYVDYTKWSHQCEMISSELKCFINGIWCNQHQINGLSPTLHRKWYCIFKKPGVSLCFVKQKQPIRNMQPETRSLAHRAALRPQSRDTPKNSWFRQAQSHSLLSNPNITNRLMNPSFLSLSNDGLQIKRLFQHWKGCLWQI